MISINSDTSRFGDENNQLSTSVDIQVLCWWEENYEFKLGLYCLKLRVQFF